MISRGLPGTTAGQPPPTGPWPLYAKILLWIAESVASNLLWKQYDNGIQIAPAPLTEADPDATIWNRVQVTIDNTTSTERTDMAVYTFDIVKGTGGSVDSTWSDADLGTVATHVSTFNSDVATHLSPDWTFVDIRQYLMAFNPYTFTPDGGKTFPPFVLSGPPVGFSVQSQVGSGALTTPPQCAMSITELVPVSHHWGRLYLPSPGDALVAGGRLSNATVDALATAYGALAGGLNNVGFSVVVPHTQVNKKPFRGLSTVSGVQVDNIVDVIRRRRYHSPTYVKKF